jgi:hypothetical protein
MAIVAIPFCNNFLFISVYGFAGFSERSVETNMLDVESDTNTCLAFLYLRICQFLKTNCLNNNIRREINV